MYKPLLFASLLLTPFSLHALDTRQTSAEQLLELGRELAAQAGASQWQQLWQRVRQAGYLQAKGASVHFTAPQAQLPELARQTLAQADRYKRNSRPRHCIAAALPTRSSASVTGSRCMPCACWSIGARCHKACATPLRPTCAAPAC